VALTADSDDLETTLRELSERLGTARVTPHVEPAQTPVVPTGALTPDAVLQAVAALMPEHAIVVDESITAGRSFFPISRSCAPHDYLQLTGGAIGAGIPMAVGAAIAGAGRKVINLEGDGSAMYTIQGLWTQARERLNVLTIVFSNGGYKILRGEMANVGATQWGPRADRLLTLADPGISYVRLAQGLGVEAAAARNPKELVDLLRHSMQMETPFLIEAVVQ
jgi:acetolactate synthase-1/2/3 large subunit